VRRALFILNLALLAMLLAAWRTSYYRQPVAMAGGYAFAFSRGRFYATGPDPAFAEYSIEFAVAGRDDLEDWFFGPPRRWIPIRHTTQRALAMSLWIVEPWFVALALAVPAATLWRRGRKRCHVARGFEVEPKAANA
jgi:hypothetical protein